MNQFRQLVPLVCVSLISIGLGYLLAVQIGVVKIKTTQESWQTYTDSEHHFSLQYPLADLQLPLDGQASTNPAEGQVSLPPAVGGKEHWFELSVLNATDKKLNQDKCLVNTDFPSTTNNRFLNGRRFCQSTSIEGAAGSVYRTDVYVTKVGDNYAVLKFTTRYTNDVHVYGNCEEDWDLSKTECKDYAFDPIRDLELLDQIANTLTQL